MQDDDRDALAAEYVLGTLSLEERGQAEALLARDAGFAETVRLWEHRLGELNVMVEAVEPPPDVWERIKSGELSLVRLASLAGRTLGCWCAPQPCHGDVLAEAAKWAAERLAAERTGA